MTKTIDYRTNKENVYEGREGLVYVRVSSKKQETEGSGRKSQEERCIHDLKSHSIPYGKTFPDTYTGGGDFMKRPAMRELLAYIDANPHKKFVVVFDDLKRFARDVEFHLKLRAVFRARNVVLRCLNYNFDESPEGRFAEVVMAGQAELEREQNRRQVIQKQRARLENGYWPFAAPQGYYMKRKDPVHGTILDCGDKRTLELIKEALDGFACGRYDRIVDVKGFLQENRYLGKKHVAMTSVKNLLTNIVYAGYVEYIKWDVPRRLGHHKGIISIDTFKKNQEKLAGRAKIYTRKDMREDFPLRGFVACTECGHLFTASWSTSRNKQKHPYYVCQSKGCSEYGKSVKKKDLEEAYGTILKKFKPKPIAIKLFSLRAVAIWDKKIKNIGTIKLNLQNDIRQNEERIGALVAKAAQSSIQSVTTAYEKQIEKLDSVNTQMQEKLDKLAIVRTDFRTALDEVLEYVKSPYNTWYNGKLATKHTVSSMVFHERPYYDRKTGFRTANFSVVIRLFEQLGDPNYKNVHIAPETWNMLETYIFQWYPVVHSQNNKALPRGQSP